MSGIQNGYFWFVAREEDAEWWHFGGPTREDAIAKGRAEYPGESFWIEEANRMEPSLALFDADEIVERISEDDCWGEDGWGGEPDRSTHAELEAELQAVVSRWFGRHATLTGANLNSRRTEQVPA